MTLSSLLDPISVDVPAGEDLSFSAEFDSILEMRREEDATLDQGDWVRALKVADWDGVVAQCEALLRSRSKDLRVAGWLTDALARTRGFAGLSDGLDLCSRLCDIFGSSIHPLAEDGDQEQRAGCVSWLLGQVVELAQVVPVIGSGDKRYGLRDIDIARARQRQPARAEGEPPAPDGTLTLDELARAQSATPREALAASLADLKTAIGALAHVEELLGVPPAAPESGS